MVIATFESRHFSFQAFGKDKEEAGKVLIKGLRAHGKGYRCEKRWWISDVSTNDKEFIENNVVFTEAKIGECLRDEEPLF